jgi:ABC-type sugar transport system ATPase subunit
VTDAAEQRPTADAGNAGLRLTGITKSFGRVQALNGVDLSVAPGEILAVVGDNGAGKSTLIKIISGVYQPDAGTISVAGVDLVLPTPADARRAGVATVFQDLALVECLDVATNMYVGQLPMRGWFVDRRKMETDARRLLDDLAVTVKSVRTPIGMLSGGQRQIVAIARGLRAGASVVLLDEPTAALGVRETAHAADLIRSLRTRGSAVILVSHDLGFVFEVADRVQVLRLGQTSGLRTIAATTKAEVVSLITGVHRDDR